MLDILRYTNVNRRDYTYIGIGTYYRFPNLKEYTEKYHQILPPFLNSIKGKTIRAINFDPAFSRDTGFLKEFFESKGYVFDGLAWHSPDFQIEVLIISRTFEFSDEFIKCMIRQAMALKTQLVVQSYAGQEIMPEFVNLYNQFPKDEQEYIKRNVLFDFTYGKDCNCSTNMLEHSHILDKDGSFLNIAIYDEFDLLGSIGVHPRLDERIEDYMRKKISKILNDDHVNYRRSVKKEPLLFLDRGYDGSSPELIMALLLERLEEALKILQRLGKLPGEKIQLFETHKKNYKDIGLHEWYSNMTQLYK